MLTNHRNVIDEEVYIINGEEFKKIDKQNGKIILLNRRTGSRKYFTED